MEWIAEGFCFKNRTCLEKGHKRFTETLDRNWQQELKSWRVTEKENVAYQTLKIMCGNTGIPRVTIGRL